MKLLAKIISVLFHPLLLTTYLAIILSIYFPAMMMIRPDNRNTIIGLICVFTFVLPAINLLMLRYFGSVTSITLYSRSQRIVPFFLISLLYLLITFLFIYKLPFSQNFNKLMMIITAMVIVSFLITFFFKISVHSLAACGAIGILLPLNNATEEALLVVPTVLVILIAGIVMSSRLLLEAHSPKEVYYGGLVGFVIGFLGMIISF